MGASTCVCGHGGPWHFESNKQKNPDWKCHFQGCTCQKFDPLHEHIGGWACCATCGCMAYDDFGKYHLDPKGLHNSYCPCREFKWPVPTVRVKMLNPRALMYDPNKVNIGLTLNGLWVKGSAWPVYRWKNTHSWTITETGKYSALAVAEDGTLLWQTDKEMHLNKGDSLKIDMDPRIGDIPVDTILAQMKAVAPSVEPKPAEATPGKRVVEI